jgi:acyl transferase domain-containing protein
LIKTDYESLRNEVDDQNHELDDAQNQDNRAIHACKNKSDIKRFYRTLSDSGFEMGPTFQTLHQAEFSNDGLVARAKVKVFPWPASQNPQPHVVHPTTLDGVLQVTMAALTHGGEQKVPTAVPTSIRKLLVAKTGLAFPGNETVIATGRVTRHSRGYEAGFSAMNESRTELLVWAEGIQSTIIADRTKVASKEIDTSLSCLRLVHYRTLIA